MQVLRRAGWPRQGGYHRIARAYGLLALGVLAGPLPIGTLLGLLPLPASMAAAVILIRNVETSRALIPAIRLNPSAAMAHGFLVAAGLWIAA